MATYSTLQKIKIRLKRFTLDDSGNPVFTTTADDIVLKQLIDENTEYFKQYRSYPPIMDDVAIEADIASNERVIIDLVLYDYNKMGIEYESHDSENEYSRTFEDKGKILRGVLPFATCI